MPLFDLKCKECENIWEDIVKLSEDTPPCPKCGGKSYKYFGMGSEIGIGFKGSGFYVNDYKNGGGSKAPDPSDV
jgi:putative FmdB family regulatory protein